MRLRLVALSSVLTAAAVSLSEAAAPVPGPGLFTVVLLEKASALVAFPASTAFQQSQNPSYVPPSKHLPDGGLLVRLQNCSGGEKYAGYGPTNHSSCNYGHGGGGDCYGNSGFVRDHIAFVPFPQQYSGDSPPTGLPRITPAQITLGPAAGLADELWGTQDPQCAYDPHTEQYYMSYTAWGGPAAGWGQKAATTADPSAPSSWHRLGPVFAPGNSWPNTAKGNESNIKCGGATRLAYLPAPAAAESGSHRPLHILSSRSPSPYFPPRLPLVRGTRK